jgi:hypothetical protein
LMTWGHTVTECSLRQAFSLDTTILEIISEFSWWRFINKSTTNSFLISDIVCQRLNRCYANDKQNIISHVTGPVIAEAVAFAGGH